MDAALGAFELMSRDVIELAAYDWIGQIALVGFGLLPIVSTLLVARGRRLAWIPLGISTGMVAVWFLYYATEWFPRRVRSLRRQSDPPYRYHDQDSISTTQYRQLEPRYQTPHTDQDLCA